MKFTYTSEDPEDPEYIKRRLEERRLFKYGIAGIAILLAPSWYLLYLGWTLTAGAATVIAMFLFIWLVVIKRP